MADNPTPAIAPGVRGRIKRLVHNRLIDNKLLNRIVDDAFLAGYLFFWARLVVRARKPFIIGVTGTVGKTTTVDLIAAMLSQPPAARVVGRVAWTESNMNNDIGLPLTILRYDDWLRGRSGRLLVMVLLPFRTLRLALSSAYPDVLVLEYGTHMKGHLPRLVQLAPPAIAVVTTIGPGHLQRLKTVEGVVEEKGALVKAVGAAGLVVLGDGHAHVAALERMAGCDVVKVKGQSVELSTAIARAIGNRLGVPEQAFCDAVARFKPPRGRLRKLQFPGLTLIDDSYNANPLSMTLGLDTLCETARPGQRRVAILGHMGELGDEAPRYHEEIRDYARARADVIIGVGTLARHYVPDHWFDSSESCATTIATLTRAGDCILVKGSYSLRMGRVVEALRRQHAPDGDAQGA